MTMDNINRDDYVLIDVTMPWGFEFKIPARGYNLRSWLAFQDKLQCTYTYKKVTQKVYDKLVFGDLKENEDGRRDKSKAQQKNPPKTKPHTKADKDSKTVRSARTRTTQVSKEARTELRESKVRNMRKPKKDVARTNNTRKATPTRTRNTKGKTQ